MDDGNCTIWVRTTEIRKNISSCYTFAQLPAIFWIPIFLEKSFCSQAQLLAPPQWSRRTSALWQLWHRYNINLTKAEDETVTLEKHSPPVWAELDAQRWQGCVGDTAQPMLAPLPVLPTGLGSRWVQLHRLKVGCRESGIENLQTLFLSLFFPPTAADDTLLLE